ncbi:MAG: helix-turn-helix domain-containing protein [Faecalibacterium sp.]
MGLGSEIGRIAKEKGINLRQLSIKSKIPYNTLYAIVKRDSCRVDPLTVQAIADTLNVPWQQLLGYEVDEGSSFDAIEELQEYFPGRLIGINESTDRLATISAKSINAFLEAIETSEDARKTEKALEKLLASFSELNQAGKTVAVVRIKELTQIPKYQRHPAPAAPQEPPATAPDQEAEQE